MGSLAIADVMPRSENPVPRAPRLSGAVALPLELRRPPCSASWLLLLSPALSLPVRYTVIPACFDLQLRRPFNDRQSQRLSSPTMSGATAGMALSAAEVAKHASKDDCWVIIHGKVRAQRAATECSVMTKELSEPCVQAYDVTGADSPNVSGFLGSARADDDLPALPRVHARAPRWVGCPDTVQQPHKLMLVDLTARRPCYQ